MLWTIAALSVGFFKQECCSGLPCPPPGDLPDPGIEPESLELTGGFFTSSTTWEALNHWTTKEVPFKKKIIIHFFNHDTTFLQLEMTIWLHSGQKGSKPKWCWQPPGHMFNKKLHNFSFYLWEIITVSQHWPCGHYGRSNETARTESQSDLGDQFFSSALHSLLIQSLTWERNRTFTLIKPLIFLSPSSQSPN